MAFPFDDLDPAPRAALGATQRIAAVSLDSTSRLMQLATQIDGATAIFNGSATSLGLLLNDTELSRGWATLPTLYQDSVHKALDLSRQCYELATRTHDELARAIEQQAAIAEKVRVGNMDN